MYFPSEKVYVIGGKIENRKQNHLLLMEKTNIRECRMYYVNKKHFFPQTPG